MKRTNTIVLLVKIMFGLSMVGKCNSYHMTMMLRRRVAGGAFGGTSFHSSSAMYMAKGATSSQGSKKKKTKVPPAKGKNFRADRVLANRGWGTRSECFDLLKQRRVFQKIASSEDNNNMEDNIAEDQDNSLDDMIRIQGPSEKIPMEADLWVDRKTQVPLPPPLLRIYHKPKWVLSVMNDAKGRPNIGNLDFIKKMHPVGRLDYDTSGLLLFSSDGKLTQTLLHPSHEIPKEYVALVVGSVEEADLRTTLANGVNTTMGVFPAELISTRPIPSDQAVKQVKTIIDNLPPEYDLDKLEERGYLDFRDAKDLTEVRLIVREGKHRMVRRILANSGFPVIGLKREKLGVIELKDLDEGSYRDLSAKEEQWAKALLKKPKKSSS